MKKRFIGKVTVSVAMLMNVVTIGVNPIFGNAVSNDAIQKDVEDLYEVTENKIKEMALEFASTMKPGLKFQVDNIVKLYTTDEEAIGYSVGFFVNGRQYGYAIYDFRISGYLKEFSLEPDGADMVENIIEIAEENDLDVDTNISSSEETRLYELSPMQYSVQVNDSEVVTSSNEVMDESEFENAKESMDESTISEIDENYVSEDELGGSSSKYDTQDKVLLKNVPSAYQIKQFNSWRQFIPSEIDTVKSQMKKWACGVTAMDILAKGTGLEHDTTKTYQLLWDYSNTSVDYTTNGISFGSTLYSKIGPAFQSFAKKHGKTISYTHGYSTTFAAFKRAIDAKQPAILGYGITSNFKRVGHFVAVEGYATTNNSNVNFLVVADGWYNAPKYINYVPGNFTDTHGTIWSGITTW